MKKSIIATLICSLMIFSGVGALSASAISMDGNTAYELSPQNSVSDNSEIHIEPIDTETIIPDSATEEESTEEENDIEIIVKKSTSSSPAGILISIFSSFIPFFVFVFFIFIIVRIFKTKSRQAVNKATRSVITHIEASFAKKEEEENGFSTTGQPVDYTERIVPRVRDYDDDFMASSFLTWANNVFVTLQNAWTQRDWNSIRSFEKEDLFNRHKAQLDEYINNGRINVIENVNILASFLNKYERNREYEFLTVFISATMNDYIINANTKCVVSGSPNKLYNKKYLLTFMRKKGVKNRPGFNKATARNCPNCGATITMTNNCKCDYCGSIITTEEYDWVLAKMDLLKPGSVVDNRGILIDE